MNAKLEHDVARLGFDGPFGQTSGSATSRLLFPCAIRATTSRSRLVSPPKVCLASVW